ncbi:hypothetical protein CHRY9390_01967 [Chryseobacterium aquaeductus]|uniref:Bacteriocin n=1 Tax=Chryseobacterium aquaeductus TaxID=2675056 RepID=A0A9N8MGC8_9FLAO|nr:hypothetical protein CHRY9390_01967 [Chryseobacterium potabilaquae]CAD7809253.1 hypothetical protein CHRY9390_01967 [Chryseobacterium aquaeductus]
MKKLNVSQMENLQGGSNRKCLIDGMLTGLAMGIGGVLAGPWGMAAALVTGGYAGNTNGCFDK